MLIVTKLKTDLHQKPYWSCMLVDDQENNRIVREVISLTFDIMDSFNKWKEFEKAHNRMAKEIMSAKNPKEQYLIAQEFLRESPFDKRENRF
jgi:hypothetical protein